MNKKLLTTGQVAEWCGVSIRTVLRWVERSELKGFRLPGKRGDYRVALDDLLNFLDYHRMPVPAEFRQRAKTALIVDDDRAVARLFEAVLKQQGFETRVASDGFAAGAFLISFQPSVVTLDLDMPGIPGLEVLKRIRGLQGLMPKILVVSGMEEGALAKALAAGADKVLPKPVSPRDFAETVNGLYAALSGEVRP